ncbi:hypothetical protein KEJ32_03355 [Candidatus Bathyarchaeota archaeon]|nr:hypothetical protein [Candidatus Bathyarchaeota archaeon]
MSEEEKTLEKAFEELSRQIKIRKQREVKGKIVNVNLGNLREFIPIEKMRNPKRADRKAMIRSSHPNSAVMRFFNLYGDWPKPGMEVKLKYSDDRFWRLDLKRVANVKGLSKN